MFVGEISRQGAKSLQHYPSILLPHFARMEGFERTW